MTAALNPRLGVTDRHWCHAQIDARAGFEHLLRRVHLTKSTKMTRDLQHVLRSRH
jgi:hypothetical protein